MMFKRVLALSLLGGIFLATTATAQTESSEAAAQPAQPAQAAQPAQPAQAAQPAQPPAANPFTEFNWAAGGMRQMQAPALYANNPNAPYAWSMFQWLSVMSNHFMGPAIDEATRFKIMEAMMRASDPKIAFGVGPSPFDGEKEELTVEELAKGEGTVPDRLPRVQIPGFPTQTLQDIRPNTVTDTISEEAKRSFYQSMMMMSPLSMRDMIGIMADKMQINEGVSFEDAVDSIKLRANEVNFKFVGHNPLWKQVTAITGEDSPRVEIFHFCDAIVARKILDYVPEFIVFIPCRIALLEDADGKLWVMTLDWDINWLNFAQNPNSELEKELRADAQRIRNAMRYIMQGAVTGDF